MATSCRDNVEPADRVAGYVVRRRCANFAIHSIWPLAPHRVRGSAAARQICVVINHLDALKTTVCKHLRRILDNAIRVAGAHFENRRTIAISIKARRDLAAIGSGRACRAVGMILCALRRAVWKQYHKACYGTNGPAAHQTTVQNAAIRFLLKAFLVITPLVLGPSLANSQQQFHGPMTRHVHRRRSGKANPTSELSQRLKTSELRQIGRPIFRFRSFRYSGGYTSREIPVRSACIYRSCFLFERH